MSIPNAPTNVELASKLELIEAELKNVQAQRTCLINEIITLNETAIEAALKEKPEPFGTVTIENFSIVVPKKVIWDQAKLAQLAKEITEGGENPSDYIKTELDVSESKFQAWPQPIKAQFIPARTVARGNASIKIKQTEK